MKIAFIGVTAIACGLWSIQSLAQVPNDEVRVGTLLSASGIKFGALANPLPLPPGDWEVIRRSDSRLSITGNDDMQSGNPVKVEVTLRNRDHSASLAAIAMTYTPDNMTVRWTSNVKCEGQGANVVDDFGTSPSSLIYACAVSHFNPNGLRTFVSNASTHTSEWVKANIAPLARYADDLPNASIWTTMNFSRDRGRNINFNFIARMPMTVQKEKLTSDTGAWIKTAGKAYLGFLQGNASAVPPFPTFDASNPP